MVSLRLTPILLGAAFIFLSGLWLIIPMLYGLPWIPARSERIRKALKLSKVLPGEIVYDLGAGDGRVLIIAAREFGARAIGIEISPLHCAVAWLRALVSGVAHRVSIQRKNFYRADLKDANVVFAYLTSAQAVRLQPQLERQLRPGTRVVTISFDFAGWQPVGYDKDELIFLYQMPPTPGDLASFLARRDSR